MKKWEKSVGWSEMQTRLYKKDYKRLFSLWFLGCFFFSFFFFWYHVFSLEYLCMYMFPVLHLFSNSCNQPILDCKTNFSQILTKVREDYFFSIHKFYLSYRHVVIVVALLAKLLLTKFCSCSKQCGFERQFKGRIWIVTFILTLYLHFRYFNIIYVVL